MSIRLLKKYKEGKTLVVEGSAQIVDDTALLDEPAVLKECQWKAKMAPGQVLWNIDIQSGDDLRGHIQAELQKRTKRS